MYDHTLDGFGLYAGEQLHIEMDALDFDVTLRERFRRWDLLLSGGARYGRMGYRSDTIFPPGECRFEGIGPTVSLEVDREVGCRGFHLIGNFRGSMLFGDVDFWGFTVRDELTTVLDNQLRPGMESSNRLGDVGSSRRVGITVLAKQCRWRRGTRIGYLPGLHRADGGGGNTVLK